MSEDQHNSSIELYAMIHRATNSMRLLDGTIADLAWKSQICDRLMFMTLKLDYELDIHKEELAKLVNDAEILATMPITFEQRAIIAEFWNALGLWSIYPLREELFGSKILDNLLEEYIKIIGLDDSI